MRDGQFDLAAETFQRAVEVSRAADCRKALAIALDNLSTTVAWTGRIAAGLAAHEEALAIFQSLGDVDGQSTALSNLAAIHVRAGRPRDAVAAQRRAIEVSRMGGDRAGEARAVSHLGQILIAEGNELGALKAHRDAVAIWRDLGDREAEAAELKTLFTRLVWTRRYSEAREAAEQAVAAFQDVGRQADAAALGQWLEYASPHRSEPPELAVPRVVTVRGCLPFLAAVGAVAAFLLDGPPILVAALAAVGLLGWGTCLTALVALPAGVAVLWKCSGTWWLVAGIALVVFAVTSARPEIATSRSQAALGIITRLDPDDKE